MIHTEDYLQLDFIKYTIKNYQLDFINYQTNNLLIENPHIIENYFDFKHTGHDLSFFLKIFQKKLIFEKPLISDLTLSFKTFIEAPYADEYLNLEDILKRPYLHNYFRDLLIFLKNKGIYNEINTELKKAAKNLKSFPEWLDFSTNFVEDYFPFFSQYFNTVSQEGLKLDFFLWIENKSIDFDCKSPLELDLTNYKYLLLESLNESNTFHLMIENKTTKNPSHSGHSHKIHYNKVDTLDFIQYLLREFDFSSKKNIPESLIKQCIENYIADNPSINKNDLTKLFKKTNGNIIEVIQKNLKTFFKNYDLGFSAEPINYDRIFVPKAHMLFLFAPHNSYDKFLKKFGKSLHEYSEDTLDIYFNKSDVKHNNGTYNHPKIMHIEFQKNDIPCLLLWNNFNSDPIIVKLHDLNHNEIFEAVKYFINCLEKNNDFHKGIDNLINYIEHCKGGKNMYINNGVIINGNKNEVKNININASESQQKINELQNEIQKMYQVLVKNSSRTNAENDILLKLIDIQQIANKNNLQEIQNSIKNNSNSEFLNFAKNVGASLFASFLML